MSIGRTKEEQELTALLSRTLVQKEVMEPMNKIGWSHAAPPPPDYSGQPAGTEGAPGNAAAPAAQPQAGQPAPAAGAPPATAPAPKADTLSPEAIAAVFAEFEALRDPQTGLIAGKYKTVPEALKGAGHLAGMAKSSFQERDAAIKRLADLQELGARPQPGASPAPATVPVPAGLAASRAALDKAQARLDAVLSSVDDNGGVVDAETLKAHSKAQREVAELAAEVRVQEMQHQQVASADAEQTKWKNVDKFMSENYPEALTKSAEIGAHIAADPVLQEAVSALVAQGKEIKASILAWQSYQRSVEDGSSVKELAAAQAKEDDLQAKEQVRQELLEKARRDAGVIQGSGGGMGIHQNEDAGAPSREELLAATRQMQMEGEGLGMPAATRFRHLLIGRTLDPSIFGPR